MIRTSIVLAALFLGTAASPPSTAFLVATSPGGPVAPVRPQPQGVPVNGYTAAPMPNSDIGAPVRSGPSETSVSPGLFSTRQSYHGEGYVPGSTVQSEQEKKLRPTPGINLSVPLQ